MRQSAEKKIAGAIRILFVVILIALQLMFVIFIVSTLRNNAVYIFAAIEIVAVINVIILASKNRKSAYTTTWIFVILIMPVFGYILYILWGNAPVGKHGGRIRASIAYGNEFLKNDPRVYRDLFMRHSDRTRMATYLGRKDFPLYANTNCKYFEVGERQFAAMLKDLENAERFIFMEYFIVETGKLWDSIVEVLARKAREGVEVRLMFDDWGSLVTTPYHFFEELQGYGIKVIRFNPIHKYISRLYLNYRNHQKITVVDGRVAYTGGTNLADEYANIYPKHGHWKDTAIRLEGDAVWGLTVNFLQMWDGEAGYYSEYERYKTDFPLTHSDGFFQPFNDGPTNNPDNPAEMMYMSMIANARDYIYITTPYLVIDSAMTDALCAAAVSGVDVRIVLPKIWDHWYVHIVTRSNYGELIKSGVRIYEYSPGYIHAKTILTDDDICITGSINMDYRSFNLHFENGVWICGAPVLANIKEDITNTFEVSQEIDLRLWHGMRPWYVRIVEGILKIFSILL